MGAATWGSLETRMQNNSFQGHKNYVCYEDVEGESGILLCVCVWFVCTCECEHAKLGLLQQFEKRDMLGWYLPLCILQPSTFMFLSLIHSSKKSPMCFPHSVISTNMFLILLEVKAGLRVDRMSFHLCPVSEMLCQ